MNLFLTVDELRELTGLTRASAQIRWLRENRWAFAVRADGRPVVSAAEASKHLETAAGRKPASAEPDFAAARRGTLQ
jgi:hypothetical protein